MNPSLPLTLFDLTFFYHLANFTFLAIAILELPIHILRTLYHKFMRLDPFALEIQGAIAFIAFGWHFSTWDWSLFSIYYAPSLRRLNDVMSLCSWGHALIAIGCLRFIILFLNHRPLRLAVALISLFCWTFWGVSLLNGPVRPLISTAFLIFAGSSAACVGMLMRGNGDHAE